MHELSVAQGILECVEEAASENGIQAVSEVGIKLGACSGIERAALEFSWELIVEGTICEGAGLVITEVPVRVHCSHCDRDFVLANPHIFRCPDCGSATPDVLAGRQLELCSIRG
jgi:hydrogenase nickel incorporation protein HypA/HybF